MERKKKKRNENKEKNKRKKTTPPVLTYFPNSFDFDTAVMVKGLGVGELKRNHFFPHL